MTTQLPALQIAIPLLSAPACLLIRRPRWTRLYALAVAWACLAVAVAMLLRTLQGEVLVYAFGGWAAPWGIEYRVDRLNAFVLVIVTTIASVVLIFGHPSAGASFSRGRSHLFYALLLLSLTGMLGMTITGDIFNVFVFLEISSLSAYSLVALGPRRRALTAAYTYLIMGTIAGTFFLLGVGMLYQSTGSLNMADIAARLPAALDRRTPFLALALMTAGLCIKLAVFPLHQWLPNAYAQAPSVVSAFLAATATKVTFYMLLRVLYGIFGVTLVFGTLRLHLVLVPLSLAAIFMGSIAAIYQTDLKRLLAYSSIAQIGTMTLALSMANIDGLTAGIVHLFNHALMKGGLFLVVGCIVHATGSSQLEDLKGLGKRRPVLMIAFLVGGLSLAGVPGTVGFISKWYLVIGALHRGWPAIAVLIVLSSLLSLTYVWRIVELAWFYPPARTDPVEPLPASMLGPAWLLIGATLVFGLSTDLTAGVARAAASTLLGVAG